MSDVKERLVRVIERINDAARRSGRRAEEVTLVAVSKTFPVEAIVEAAEAGITNFGENKAQEFAVKVDALSHLESIRWHFVGHLQRNKVKLVVGRADLFHGLDSARIAQAVQSRARQSQIRIDCLIQVNVSGEKSKYGINPSELPRLAEELSETDSVRIRGLMALASQNQDPNVARNEFRLLRRLGDSLPGYGHDEADILSMGMSGDFELAIEEGATLVRIGSAIFGSRVYLYT